MDADELLSRWPTLETGADRLKWARMMWQTRAQAVSATAEDAAVSMGMKGGTYRAYERDVTSSKHTPLDHQAAIKFARKFGVSWLWLLLGEGTPFDHPIPSAQERILKAMEDVEAAQQEAVADLVERMVGAFRKSA